MKAIKEAIALLKFFKDRKNTRLTTMIKAQSCIAELEALQSRSCESCKNWETGRKTISTCILGVCDGTCFSTKVDFMFELQVVNGTHKDFCCNKYEAKDKQ